MNRLLIVLIYCLIATIPIGLLMRVKLFTNVNIVPQDLIVFAIFIVSTILAFKTKKFLFVNKYFFFQSLFIMTGIISLIFNFFVYKDINLVVSLLYTFRYFAYMNLILLGIFKLRLIYLKPALFLMSLFLIIFGFIQYFFYNNLKYLFHLGWDDHLYRLFSTFLDPNFAGTFYVIVLLYLLYFVLTKRFGVSFKELIISFFILISVYLTFSRSALLSLATAVITLGILNRKFKILIIVLVFMFGSVILFSDIGVEGLNPFRTESSTRRIISYNESLNIIYKSNYLGVGLNAYRDAQIRYGTRNEKGAATSNADAGTDNSYLFVLATTGVLGFVFYILSYSFLVKDLIKEKLKINLYLIGCLVAVFTASLFINALFYTPILSLIFLLIAFRKELN